LRYNHATFGAYREKCVVAPSVKTGVVFTAEVDIHKEADVAGTTQLGVNSLTDLLQFGVTNTTFTGFDDKFWWSGLGNPSGTTYYDTPVYSQGDTIKVTITENGGNYEYRLYVNGVLLGSNLTGSLTWGTYEGEDILGSRLQTTANIISEWDNFNTSIV